MATTVTSDGFPQELILKALTYLDPLTSSGRKGLAKCLILSKTYHSIALPLLYDTVTYTGKAEHQQAEDGMFKPFVAYLQSHPVQASLIKNLFISGHAFHMHYETPIRASGSISLCLIRDIIDCLTSLKSLGFYDMTIFNICDHSVHNLHDCPPFHIRSTSSSPRQIQHLLLHNINLSGIHEFYLPHINRLSTANYMQISHFQHLLIPDAMTLHKVQRSDNKEHWIALWTHSLAALYINFHDFTSSVDIVAQMAMAHGLKDFQAWGVDGDVKDGVISILQRNHDTLETLALGICVTYGNWAEDWQSIGLESCTALKTLCLGLELSEDESVMFDRWFTLINLLHQIPPNVQDLRLAFNPTVPALTDLDELLTERPWGYLSEIFQARAPNLQSVTLEMIGVGCEGYWVPENNSSGWAQYNADLTQEEIRRSFGEKEWQLFFNGKTAVKDVFPYGPGRDLPLQDKLLLDEDDSLY